MTVLDVHELQNLVGVEAISAWIDVSQETIARFAEVTSDQQWIHIDPERARRESPYGTTIAHGFLTLSLLSRLMRDAVRINGTRLTINYGVNKVRFPAPLASGSRVRGRFTLQRVEPVTDAWQAIWNAKVEREGADKPCCVAEWLVRYHP